MCGKGSVHGDAAVLCGVLAVLNMTTSRSVRARPNHDRQQQVFVRQKKDAMHTSRSSHKTQSSIYRRACNQAQLAELCEHALGVRCCSSKQPTYTTLFHQEVPINSRKLDNLVVAW